MVVQHDGKTLPEKSEVSIASTLGRTACLIGGTLLLMVIVRFCAPVSRAMQHAAGSALWQRAYTMLHITSALGREQLMLSTIVILCFLVALSVQIVVLWGWQRYSYSRRRSE